jgi:hypothetical protein
MGVHGNAFYIATSVLTYEQPHTEHEWATFQGSSFIAFPSRAATTTMP